MLSAILKLIKVSKTQIAWMLLASFIGFLTIGSSIGLLMTSAYIIAKAALMPSIAELQVAIVGVRFFGISRGIFRYLERYISHQITFEILASIRLWVFKLITPLFPSKTPHFNSSEMLGEIVSDIEDLEEFFIKIIAPPLVAFFVLILFTILFSYFSLYYAIALAVIYLTSGIILPYATFYLGKDNTDNISNLRRDLTELSVDQIQGMSELLAFGRVNSFTEKYEKINREYISAQRKKILIDGLNESLLGFLMYFAVIIILVLAIPDVTNNTLEGVYLSVLVLGTMAVFEALQPLPNSLNVLFKSSKTAESLSRFEETIDEKDDKIKNFHTPQNHSIKVESVKFSYDGEKHIYNNLNLNISSNSSNIILGESGAGKSTITNLLLKNWDYFDGDIKIGDVDLKEISKDKISDIISIVPQQTHLFNLSIKENLRFAKLTASDNEITAASSKANIHEFIKSLPNEYDEIIGEFGTKLSGGEKQRLSIARSILRNTPIIIFDEPTSNLDKQNSNIIMEMIYDLAKSKTIIVITHNLNFLKDADKIFVLDKGNIIESGNYSGLIKVKSRLKEMLLIESRHLK